MKAKSVIRNLGEPTAQVSVVILINAVKDYSFVNRAMDAVQNTDLPISPAMPFVTFRAIEAAIISGVFYAKRVLEIKGGYFELVAFDLKGHIENVIPFAVAAHVAVCGGMANKKEFSENDLCGWQVITIDTEGHKASN